MAFRAFFIQKTLVLKDFFEKSQKHRIEDDLFCEPLPIFSYRHLSLKYRIAGRIRQTFIGSS